MLATRKSKRKPSGGLKHTVRARDRRLYELANHPTETTIAKKEDKKKFYRGKGANKKVKLVETKTVSLVLPDKKIIKGEIKTVKKNAANREYQRRNVMTKGAEIVVLADGKEYHAKITSRPGQSGTVSAKVI